MARWMSLGAINLHHYHMIVQLCRALWWIVATVAVCSANWPLSFTLIALKVLLLSAYRCLAAKELVWLCHMFSLVSFVVFDLFIYFTFRQGRDSCFPLLSVSRLYAKLSYSQLGQWRNKGSQSHTVLFILCYEAKLESCYPPSFHIFLTYPFMGHGMKPASWLKSHTPAFCSMIHVALASQSDCRPC